MKAYDVIAIGELNVDLILTGLKRMPVPGQEIIAENGSLVLGSSTAIAASGMAKMGLRTGLIGKLGRDKFGDVVLEGLMRNGIDTSHIHIEDGIATGLTVSLSSADNRALVTHLGSIELLTAADVDLKLLEQARHIHVGSFFLQHGLRSGLAGLFREARRRGITTSLDAGWDDSGDWDYGIREVLAHTDIFFPNETEALHLTGASKPEEALDKLSAMAGADCRVVVKCGADGAIARHGTERARQRSFAVTPVDTTGAGDSFNAGFVYGFLTGQDLAGCLRYGSACGAISVTKIGGATSCATPDEVAALFAAQPE